MKRLGLLILLVLCQQCMAEYVVGGSATSTAGSVNSVLLARLGIAGAAATQRSVTTDPSQQNRIVYSALSVSVDTGASTTPTPTLTTLTDSTTSTSVIDTKTDPSTDTTTIIPTVGTDSIRTPGPTVPAPDASTLGLIGLLIAGVMLRRARPLALLAFCRN